MVIFGVVDIWWQGRKTVLLVLKMISSSFGRLLLRNANRCSRQQFGVILSLAKYVCHNKAHEGWWV